MRCKALQKEFVRAIRITDSFEPALDTLPDVNRHLHQTARDERNEQDNIQRYYWTSHMECLYRL